MASLTGLNSVAMASTIMFKESFGDRLKNTLQGRCFFYCLTKSTEVQKTAYNNTYFFFLNYALKTFAAKVLDQAYLQCWMNDQRSDALLVVGQSDQRLASCQVPQTYRCVMACRYHLDTATIKSQH